MKRLIAVVLLGVSMTGCGALGNDQRTNPNANHRLCGISGGTVLQDSLLFFLGPFGLVAWGVDLVSGGLWYSDKECNRG